MTLIRKRYFLYSDSSLDENKNELTLEANITYVNISERLSVSLFEKCMPMH